MSTETAPPLEKPADAGAAAAADAAGDQTAKHPVHGELMKMLLEDVPDDQRPPGRRERSGAETDTEKSARETKEREDKEKADAALKQKEIDDAAAAQPIRARKPKAAARPDPFARPAPAAPASPAAAAPAAAPAKPDDSDLEEPERQTIKDAADMEKRFPDKYKGLGDKTRKFIRDHIEFIAKNGGDDFDDTTPEYQRFLEQNRPKITPQDLREFQEARIAERASAGPMRELQRMKHDNFVAREEPKVVQEGSTVYRQLANTDGVIPKEIRDEIAELSKTMSRQQAYAKVYPDYKLELDTVHEFLTGVADGIREFSRLSRVDPDTKLPMAVEVTDPKDPKFPQHERLRQIVKNVCNGFRDAGGEELLRDGKWFLTKDEWFRLKKENPGSLGRYWTFSNKEIMQRALKTVASEVAQAIAFKKKQFEDSGFVRKPKAVAVKTEAQLKEERRVADEKLARPRAPAAPHPSPVPGVGAGSGSSDGAKLAAALNRD